MAPTRASTLLASPPTNAALLPTRTTVTLMVLAVTLCRQPAVAVVITSRAHTTTTCRLPHRTTGKCPTKDSAHPAWHSNSHRVLRAPLTTTAAGTARPNTLRSLTHRRWDTVPTLSTSARHLCTPACLLTNLTRTAVTTSLTLPTTTHNTLARVVLLRALARSTPTLTLARPATLSLHSCRPTWRARLPRLLSAHPRALATPPPRASHTHRPPRLLHSRLPSRAPALFVL